MGGNWWVEVMFLAMLAGFIALRLVSVLGRRTGHEPAADGVRGATAERRDAAPAGLEARARPLAALPDSTPDEARAGLTAIADVDAAFDPARFLAGASEAYSLVLNAFWAGDLSPVEAFVSDDVASGFRDAIAQRLEDGLTIDNRVLSVDRASLAAARLDGNMAEVTVRYDAAIAGVTRARDGTILAGSSTDAVRAHDEWTFRRHVTSNDPNWLLVATAAVDD